MPDNLPPQPNPSPVPPPLTPTAGPAGQTSTPLEPNIAAAVAAATLVGGILLLVTERRNQFVRFWAMQSVFALGAVIVCCIAFTIFSWLFAIIVTPLGPLGWILLWLLRIVESLVVLGFLIGWVYAILRAYGGKEWEIPVLGPMARRQLAKLPIY